MIISSASRHSVHRGDAHGKAHECRRLFSNSIKGRKQFFCRDNIFLFCWVLFMFFINLLHQVEQGLRAEALLAGFRL